MNERVLRMEKIINTMVVKLMKEAEEKTTKKSSYEYNIYKRAVLGRSKITEYKFEALEIARMIPRLSMAEAELIAEDVNHVFNILSKEEIDRALSLKRIKVISSYVEYNEYYRKIMGLPPLKHTEKDFVKINDINIHELPIGDINALKYSGELDLIIVKYSNNPEYDYLKYLGKGIDVWKAHESTLFEILFIENTEDATEYRSYYNQERKVFLRTYSSKYLNRFTEYNEAYELNYLKFMSLSNMEMMRYSPALNKDSFTVEEAIDKWKEFGLVFPKDMPALYRNTTTFLLNYLSLFKGTNYVMEFITKRLFSGLELYKYYITKKPKPGLQFPIPPETPPWEVYDVEFIQVPFEKYYTEVINEEELRVLTYNDVVERDPKWQDTEELKKAVFSEEFSFVESKYLGMNFFVDLERFSADFSTMVNLFLEYRDVLNEMTVYYPTTGTNEKFINMFIYFLALFGYLLTKEKVVDPNSMVKYRDEYVYGFYVPEDIEPYRIQFIKFFFNTPYRHILNNFPERVDNSDEFFDVVEKLDKQVSFVEKFDELVFYCKSHEDYKFLNNLIRLCTLLKTNPKRMGLDDFKIDGMTYEQYLKINSPSLYSSFTYLLSLNIEQNFSMEFDTIIQVLIEALDRDNTDDLSMVKKLQALLQDSSVFINGVNKYLMYILKLFKAYSTDFLTEEADYNLTTGRNYTMQIDEMYFEYDVSMEDKHNTTQIDRIHIERSNPIYRTTSRTKDSIILNSPYGDCELETK